MGLLGAWGLPGLPLVAAFTPTPTLALVTPINGGSVIPGAGSGTLVLADSPIPSGTRSATSGTTLGGSPVFALGKFTITGGQGDGFTLANGATGSGANTINLTHGTKKMTVTFATVTFSCTDLTTPPYSGKFPTGTPNTTTTTTVYVGMTVAVNTLTLNPVGTYTGTLILKVRDTTDNKPSANLSVPITVKVDTTPITLSRTADLDFGAIFPSATAGTVVMSTAGTRTPTGGVTLGAFMAGSAASFNLAGVASAGFATTFSSTPTPLVLTGPGSSMTVDTFTSSASALGAGGTLTLAVGATLHVGVNQAQGAYSGTFTVTVAYD